MSEFRNGVAAHLRRLIKDDGGATAIEYAIIASGVSLAIMTTLWTLGATVKTSLYDRISALF
jgi:Flp pilus assembly pilin Flp